MKNTTYLHAFSLEYGFQCKAEPCSEDHINQLFPFGNYGYGIYSYEKDAIPQILLDKVSDVLDYKLEEIKTQIDNLRIQEALYKEYKDVCKVNHEEETELEYFM